MDLKIGYEYVNRILPAQNRVQFLAVVNTIVTIIKFLVSYTEGNFLTSCATTGFSGKAMLHKVRHTYKQNKLHAVFNISLSVTILAIPPSCFLLHLTSNTHQILRAQRLKCTVLMSERYNRRSPYAKKMDFM
jgi:hypothetical protein